ncbi:MAG: helix-turn-helix transcriptional regulator [Bdellovibrionales bacterium]|nr:helix-turn-helix transcriptional regulator [Bdellovibrionales bacterium]
MNAAPLRVRLVKLCERRRLRIKDLAKISGVSRNTIQGWISGKRPCLDKLQRVALALDVSFYELAFGIPDPKSPRMITRLEPGWKKYEILVREKEGDP